MAASAQTVHIVADPEPETERCQNHHAAFHADGDVVMVEYHGQWKTYETHRMQHGGLDRQRCEIERVMRLSPDRRVVWEIRPTHDRSEHALARQDRIHGVVAMPDGGTVISVSDGRMPDSVHSNLLYFEESGELRWRLRTKHAPQFSMITPHAGPNNALFAKISATNYAYEGGVFQLPGSDRTELRPHQVLVSVVRIAPDDGEVMWERFGMQIADVTDEFLITTEEDLTRKPVLTTQYTIRKISYDGTVQTEAKTPRMPTEKMLSATYHDEHLVMTTRKEHLNESRDRVERRTGNLRVFDMDGELVHTRQVADGSRLAKRTGEAPIRIVSPTECTRGVSAYRCVTDTLHVITMDDWDEEAAWSRLTFPRGGLVENDHIEATSTPGGLWLSARTYYGSGPDDDHHPESVTALYSPDDMRTPIQAQDAYVWTPRPRTKTQLQQPLLLIP
jgi:hypothetical protein